VKILDATAGNRAIWFRKTYPDAIYLDARDGLNQNNTVGDCRHTTFAAGEFDLIVFDPPHMTVGPNSLMAERYGHYLTHEIRELVRDAFAEFHRILKEDGLVAFKWSDHDTSIHKILEDVHGFDPLVGVPTAQRTKHSAVTYWCLLRRVELPA